MDKRSNGRFWKRMIIVVLLLCALMALAGCSSTKTCETCRGVGYLEAGGLKLTCPTCDGRGRIN